MTDVVLSEVDIVIKRLVSEERFMSFLYDDADDQPVAAPKGNATIGYGCNVQAGWSLWLSTQVLRIQVQERQNSLVNYSWYMGMNAARRSVILDVAFNDGLGGLLSFHLMIAAIEAQNWSEAKLQCHVRNPKLATRYEILGKILLTGSL